MATANSELVGKSTESKTTIIAPPTSSSSLQRRTSCGTVCSSNSSCLLQKRKTVSPLQASLRTMPPRTPNKNAVKQRVLSAKLIKLRSMQSQLNDANYHLTELSRENRALKALQNRQDKALKNYEGTNADLPRLIKSHENEMRVMQEKNKLLRKTVTSLTEQVKTKDEEIANLTDHLKHLTALSREKNLEERHKLSEKLDDANLRIKQCDDELSTLNRKLILETKNFRFKLNAEIGKNKQCQRELAHALTEVDRLNNIIDNRNRSVILQAGHRRRNHRDSVSLVALNGSQSACTLISKTELDIADSKELESTPSEIHSAKSSESFNVMRSPEENILVRLSSSGSSSHSQQIDSPTTQALTNRPRSVKLVKIVNEKSRSDCKYDRGSAVVTPLDEQPKESIMRNKTDAIMESLKLADFMDRKLRQNNLSEINIPKRDLDLANEIWKEEYDFQQTTGRKSSIPRSTRMMKSKKEVTDNGDGYALSFANISLDETGETDERLELRRQTGSFNMPEDDVIDLSCIETPKSTCDSSKSRFVSEKDKTRLLATLRAIDNGESFESVSSLEVKTHTSDNLMKELFG